MDCSGLYLLMKKSYDWEVKLHVQANQKRLEVVASIHTNIHKLKIEVAKRLGLSVLDSHIDIYHQGKLMKPTSTLLQNQVSNMAVLTANVARCRLVPPSFSQKLDGAEKEAKGGKGGKGGQGGRGGSGVRMQGLSVVCSCSNSKCVNYNQDVQIEYGFGVFPILNLTAFTKCEFCPYKSQFLRPNMLCKEVKACNCYMRLRGSEPDRGGIPVSKDSGFVKVCGERQLGGWLEQRPWHMGMQLTVKHL